MQGPYEVGKRFFLAAPRAIALQEDNRISWFLFVMLRLPAGGTDNY